MPIPDLDGNERDVFYDAIPDYSRRRGKPKPLDEGWLDEFETGVEDTQLRVRADRVRAACTV